MPFSNVPFIPPFIPPVYNNTAGRVGGGTIGYIPSPDWSNNLVTAEDPTLHAASKFLGGTGLTIATPAALTKLGLLGKSTSTIDTLTAAASRAKNTVGAGRGAVHGTRVHTAFEAEVNALGNANLTTEVSYMNGKRVVRGTRGSIRADVVEGVVDAPTAIYDLKTGSAVLRPSRVQQIQSHVPGGSNVPIHPVR